MSRQIHVEYQVEATASPTVIEVPPPYFLFGTHRSSIEFWSLPRLREIGITRLTLLGKFDPIYFDGWEDMSLLEQEIQLLHRHLRSINFHVRLKKQSGRAPRLLSRIAGKHRATQVGPAPDYRALLESAP